MNKIEVIKLVPVKMTFVDTDVKQVRSVVFDVKYSLKTEASQQSYDEAFIQQNISYQTANTFLWDQLHQSICYTKEGKSVVENTFCEFDNNFMILPVLNEAVLSSVLHCKLNNIIHENSMIEKVTVSDPIDQIEYSFENDEFEYYQLPEIKEWLGDFAFWEKPWWERRDFSTYDNFAIDQEEYDAWTQKEDKKIITERMCKPLYDIEEQVIASFGKEEIMVKEKGQLIEVDFSKKKSKSDK